MYFAKGLLVTKQETQQKESFVKLNNVKIDPRFTYKGSCK